MSLTSVKWLLEHIEDPDLRVLDVRWYLADPDKGASEYVAAHIPGAVFLDLETELSDLSRPGEGRHPLPNLNALSERLEALGIGTTHKVVAYDHGPSSISARAWWLLRHMGHHDVHVLDGGMAAWVAAEGRLSTAVPSHRPAAFAVSPRTGDTVDLDRVAALGDALLLDARAPERYRGETEPIDPVAGHIPGARNLPFESLVGSDFRLLPDDVLAARFASVGVKPDTEVIVACGSGVNACQLILAAVVAGLPEPKLYPGSYSQWSRAGMPVTTGPDS